MANSTAEEKILNWEVKKPYATLDVGLLITVLINIITCPFTVLLNVMVIMAVKRRPRLQTNANILLACLAGTNAFTGLIVQPSYILRRTLQLIGITNHDTVGHFHGSFLRGLAVCSSLHLMLVNCERLIAIRFTEHYPYIVIKRNIKMAVIAFWIIAIFYVVIVLIDPEAVRSILNLLSILILISCVLFIASAYVILYRETLRHRKKIKTQQLPQEEVRRFAKESKALKTTVLVVGAVVLCFLPMAFTTLLFTLFKFDANKRVRVVNSCLPCPWAITLFMLNSFFNPLIYCWRQKEMRQFIFRLSPQAVAPEEN